MCFKEQSKLQRESAIGCGQKGTAQNTITDIKERQFYFFKNSCKIIILFPDRVVRFFIDNEIKRNIIFNAFNIYNSNKTYVKVLLALSQNILKK